MKAARDSWINPIVSLALCVAAGVLFAWLRTPLPWMIGPLLVMAACNFAGARLRAPPLGRQAGQLVIGTALGLYFTPAVAREVVSYWPVLLGAAVFAIVLAWACGWFLSRTTGVDRTTSFFASVPGGAAEMAMLGERFGGRVDRIVFAQSLRMLVVVVAVPFALTYSGAHGTDPYAPTSAVFDAQNLCLLFAAGVAAGAAASRIGMSNPYMLGPLLCTIALAVCEVRLSSIPIVVTNAAQLLLGCVLASRFERQFMEGLGRYAAAVLTSIFLALLLAVAFSAGLAWATQLPLATLILATAPGGIAEMCITAKVLQLGVPVVTAAHVTRVLILLNAAGPLYRIAKRVATR